MPSAIRVFLALCLFGSLALAPAQASAAPQIGFAIVTVDSGNSIGIVASETLIHSVSGRIERTGVSPALLLTNSALVVHLGSPADGSTGIAIVNPTAIAANVQLSATDTQGTPILNRTISILPRGQLS